ncbi:MAG: cation transporter [Gammaproteobacteria bacterium]|nr:cation transporter [Gammaproteobacteria bacterium]
MTDCCNDKACETEALRKRQSSVLKIVLGINAVMFIVELTAGLISGSVSLVADSLDMLGDTLVYGFSIYVVAREARMKAHAALLKGGIMAVFGVFVLGQAIYKIIYPQLPVFETMGAIGLLALTANSICFILLWRHRADDINMSSVWLCSRNDIIANVSVLLAAAGVWLTHSGWPDILVGLALAALFLRSALFVLRGAIIELQNNQGDER